MPDSSFKSPPSKPALSALGRFVLERRLAWIGWRVDRLKSAHERLAKLELSLSQRLTKSR